MIVIATNVLSMLVGEFGQPRYQMKGDERRIHEFLNARIKEVYLDKADIISEHISKNSIV